jgi:hypothetical protein
MTAFGSDVFISASGLTDSNGGTDQACFVLVGFIFGIKPVDRGNA